MACPLCEAGCGLRCTLAPGPQGVEVTLVRGDPDDVHSRGYLCPKASALKDLHHDPDRVRRPLVRRNGEFVETDADEAFAEIERRLLPIREAYGPASCGLVIGNPAVHRTGLVLYLLDLAAALGSPNVFSAASLDQMPKHVAVGEMYGDHYSMPVPDIDRTELLVLIGTNPMVSNGSMWSVPDFRGRARALQARGGRIVVVDPRRTETADLADRHLPVRPGSDVFLLAALVQTLFGEGLVRLGRMAEHVAGLHDVEVAVRPFVPERVADRCGIDADEIRTLARDLAASPAAVVTGRLGTCHQRHATVVNWLVEVVNIVTGHLDEPGGAMFPRPAAFAGNTRGLPGVGAGVSHGAYRSRVSGAREVMGQLPMACLAEEIDTPGDGRIRALVTIGANPALSAPNGPRVSAALASLDLLVCLDVYRNETTRHADVILPGPSPFETAQYDLFFSQMAHRNTVRWSDPVLPMPDGVLDDWQTMVRLVAIARGEGAGADIDAVDDLLAAEMLADLPAEVVDAVLGVVGGRGVERRVDLALRSGPFGDQFGMLPDGLTLERVRATPSGIDLGPLDRRVPEVLRTPSGRIELAPPTLIEELAAATAELADEVPDCVIVGRRHLRSNNSWMHNLPVLAKGRSRCTLLVHPADAVRFGVTDGGRARVTAEWSGAAVDVDVEVDDAMRPGVVSLPHGWGHDQPDTLLGVASLRPGVNLNVLTSDDRRDSLSGNPALSETAVSISPIAPT